MDIETESQLPKRCVLLTSWIDGSVCNALIQVIVDSIGRTPHDLTVVLSCPGGDIYQAITVYNVLVGSGINATAHNIGFVDSAALTIYLGAKRRLASPNATFLIHGATFTGPLPIDVHQAQSIVRDLERLNEQTLRVLASNTNDSAVPEDVVRESFNHGRVVTIDEAKTWKLIHAEQTLSIEPGSEVISL